MMDNLSEFYADTIHHVLSELKISKVVYVGFATGGHVGMIFSTKYPTFVEQLILVNTSPQFAKSADWPYGFDAKARDYFNKVFDSQTLKQIAQILLKPAMQENCQNQLGTIKEQFTHMTEQSHAETFKAFFNNIAEENFLPLLPQIKVSTLIIQSSLDKEVVPPVAVYMREHIENSQLIEINGADHFVFATRCHLFNTIIEQFINPQCQLCHY